MGPRDGTTWAKYAYTLLRQSLGVGKEHEQYEYARAKPPTLTYTEVVVCASTAQHNQ